MKSPLNPVRWLSTVLAVAVLCCGAAQAGELYLFGDSLTDSGNNAVLTHGGDPNQVIAGNYYVPTYPYASGVYSNGRVWASHFAAVLRLHEGAVPSLLGGDDFAFGGARAATDIDVPSATTQLSLFLARGVKVHGDDLFIIAVGGNDLRDTLSAVSAAAAGDPSTIPGIVGTAAQNFAAAVGAMVDTLQARGARHILVWNTPNLGLAPAVRFQDALYPTLHVAATATQIAGAFNGALAARLARERGVTVFDLFGTVGDFVAHKEKYGFVNVTDAAGAVPGVDPDTYLFWDGIHPTAHGHAALARAVLDAWAAVLREVCGPGHDSGRDRRDDRDDDRGWSGSDRADGVWAH